MKKHTVLIMSCLLTLCFAGCRKNSSGSYKETYVPTQTEAAATQSSVDEKETFLDCSGALSAFNKGNYLYVTGTDLDKFSDELTGFDVYTVAEIGGMSNDAIQIRLTDGHIMSSFKANGMSIYKKYLKTGDLVAIIGTVDSSDSFPTLGKSVTLTNCGVIAFGKDAEKYRHDVSDENVINGTKPEKNKEISEAEYKSGCTDIDYISIISSPDTYKDKLCRVNGTVTQETEISSGQTVIFVKDGSGNLWKCIYTYKNFEARHSSGSSITCFGKVKKIAYVNTANGDQLAMPEITTAYIV